MRAWYQDVVGQGVSPWGAGSSGAGQGDGPMDGNGEVIPGQHGTN